jgi:DNA-binding CsgD family transcriptional regulator/PAS domain-containing protein
MRHDQRDAAASSVRLLYQALEDSGHWEKALTALADELRADHVVLDVRADVAPLPAHFIAARVDPAHLEQFSVHQEYPLLRSLVTKASAGTVVQGESVIDRRLRARSEFYNDVILPMGGYHSLLAVAPRAGNTRAALLTACRTSRRKSFETRHQRQLECFLPHLQTVLRLSSRLSSMAAEQWWYEKVLSALPIGVVLLDERGLPCYANPVAESLLGASDLLSLSAQHGLRSSDAEIGRQLRQAILSALGQPGTSPQAVVRAHCPRRKIDIWLQVAPLAAGGAACADWSPARVVVFCDGPDSTPLDPEQLARAFGFTPREAALAQTLLDGQELSSAAQSLGVGRETVRSQLKSLFAKTDTNRQAELAQVLRKFKRWSPH